MLTVLLLLSLLNTFLVAVIFLHLGGIHLQRQGKRPPPTQKPTAQTYDTLRLVLFDHNSVPLSEVSFHGPRPPSTYEYGGRYFRYHRTHRGVYEYSEAGR